MHETWPSLAAAITVPVAGVALANLWSRLIDTIRRRR